MAADTTVIIVTFNSSSIIQQCINSFKGYPIIIVDNNSTDNTEKLIKEKHPQIKIIQTGKNLGYGRANNVGLNAAKTKYGLIINPDIFISTKQIQALEKISKKHPHAAMIAPFFVNPDWNLENFKADISDTAIEEVSEKLYSVTSVTGCTILCDIEKIKKIGLFDENIFMFCEEHDLCNRVRKYGSKILQASNILVPHLPGKSSPSNPKIIYLRAWHQAWSKLYLRRKNKGRFKTIYSYPKYLSNYLKNLIKGIFTANKVVIIENLASISGTLNHMFGIKAFDENDNPRGFF